MDKVIKRIRIVLWIFTIIFALSVISGLIYVVKEDIKKVENVKSK